MKLKQNQQGFHAVSVIVAILVIAILGFVGWRVMGSNKPKEAVKSVNDGSSQRQAGDDTKGASSSVIWMWGGDKWLAQGGSAPTCKSKPVFSMPVDINQVSSVLYPGQQRSTGYKTHGGFRLDTGSADVTIPADSNLVKASRYIEQGEVQYFMVFTLPCGYAYRFDHLRTLTPKFQAIMDKLPQPQVDDSRTTSIEPAVSLKAGEKVATGVGFAKTNNASVDFGIYDLRQANKASKDPAYAAKHQDEKEYAYYGSCFFDYFSSDVAAKLRALPAADQMAGKTSDYCQAQ